MDPMLAADPQGSQGPQPPQGPTDAQAPPPVPPRPTLAKLKDSSEEKTSDSVDMDDFGHAVASEMHKPPDMLEFKEDSKAVAYRQVPTTAESEVDLLTSLAKEPLTEDLVETLRKYVMGHSTLHINRRTEEVLDLLAYRSALSSPKSSAELKKPKKQGFFSRFRRGSTLALGDKPVATYPDVRAETYVVNFAPKHKEVAGVAGKPASPAGYMTSKAAATATMRSGPRRNIPMSSPTGAGPSLPTSPTTSRVHLRSTVAAGQVTTRIHSDSEATDMSGSSTRYELEPCPCWIPLSAKIRLRNVGKLKAQITLRPLVPHPARSAHIEVDPPVLYLKKGREAEVTVRMQLIQPGSLVCGLISMEVAGGLRTCFVARAYSEKSVFGVPLKDLATVEDAGYQVPAVLASLRKYILENNGLEKEGIFRIGPKSQDVAEARHALNEEEFDSCRNAYVAAHMIKVFFRELYPPILNSIPTETLLSVETTEQCLKAVESLTPEQQALFWWLFELLSDVVEREEVNKMSAKNCAIVMGPNLYHVNKDTNPMESLMASQKAVHFLNKMIQHMLDKRRQTSNNESEP